MIKFASRGAMLAGVLGFVLSGIAVAQIPGISGAEFKCQQKNDKAGSKYVKAATKCSSKCMDAFWKQKAGANPADCYAPFGGSAATCVRGDPLVEGSEAKSANGKFIAAIRKACDPSFKIGSTAECPECYAGGDCGLAGYAGAHQQIVEAQVSGFGPGVFCRTGADVGTSATAKAEAKCQLKTADNLSKFVGGVNKCFDKCFKDANSKGTPVYTDCIPAPVLPADQPTVDCLNLAQQKAILKVDQNCKTAGVVPLCPKHCESDAACDARVCNANADCDTSPGSGDGVCDLNPANLLTTFHRCTAGNTGVGTGVCTDLNCTAGDTFAFPYPDGATWTGLVVNVVAGNIWPTGSDLDPFQNIYCSDPAM